MNCKDIYNNRKPVRKTKYKINVYLIPHNHKAYQGFGGNLAWLDMNYINTIVQCKSVTSWESSIG